MKELLKDPDADGKLSAARAPLVALCGALGVAWLVAGIIIVWTHLAEPEGDPLTWDTLDAWFRVGTGALWPLVAGYVGGKGVGKLPKAARHLSDEA